MRGPFARLAAFAGLFLGLVFSSPALASYNDQFPCRSDDDMSVLVYISADDSNLAVLQVVPSEADKVHTHELRRKPGGSWEDFRYEDDGHHVFVGGNGKGVLLMHGKSFVCEFAGDPGDAQEQAEETGYVLLGPGGLDIVAPGVSLPDGMSFGVSEAVVVDQLAEVLGPPAARETNEECGAGPMAFRRFGSLMLNFSEGQWVGWFLDKGEVNGVPVTLQDGLTVGSRAGELANAADYQPESTLGDEFFVDGISGLSTDRGSDAPIESLWAGTNCMFR